MFIHLKNALKSIWANKVRSFLTVLGIVIGVASVTMLVSLGQGLQNDMTSLIQGLGTNVMVVIGGKMDLSSSDSAQQMNPANFASGEILTNKDIETIKSNNEVEHVTPISLVAGAIVKKDSETFSPMVMGARSNILQSFQVLEIKEGRIFDDDDEGVIVIGPGLKESFFGDESAIDKKLMVNNEEFDVIGTIAQPKTTSLFASDFDYVALVPFDKSTELNHGEENITRIVFKANDNANVADLKNTITDEIKSNHDGEDNFTVFTQEDLLDVFNQFLGMATALVSAIAAISLIVGGIGIMNIMLVTVTERTREIGLRKAVGATRFAILSQFLIESVVITLIGGAIGLGLALAGGIIVGKETPLQASITPEVVLIAVGVSVAIGIIFGIWPALNAARKDPIEALRHE